ncbi:MAG TPA: hypothetical protein VIT21_12805 [Chthoniobacterales bacterium]
MKSPPASVVAWLAIVTIVIFLLFPPWNVHVRDVDVVYPLGSHWISSRHIELDRFLPPQAESWIHYTVTIDQAQQAIRIAVTGLIAAVLYLGVRSNTKNSV